MDYPYHTPSFPYYSTIDTTPTTPSFPSFPWELFTPYYTHGSSSPKFYQNHGYSPHTPTSYSPHPPHLNPYSSYPTSHYSPYYKNSYQFQKPTNNSSHTYHYHTIRDFEKHFRVVPPYFKKSSNKIPKPPDSNVRTYKWRWPPKIRRRPLHSSAPLFGASATTTHNCSSRLDYHHSSLENSLASSDLDEKMEPDLVIKQNHFIKAVKSIDATSFLDDFNEDKFIDPISGTVVEPLEESFDMYTSQQEQLKKENNNPNFTLPFQKEKSHTEIRDLTQLNNPEQQNLEGESRGVAITEEHCVVSNGFVDERRNVDVVEWLCRKQELAAATAAASNLSVENDPLAVNYGFVPLIEIQSNTSVDVNEWTQVEALDDSVAHKPVKIRGRAQTIRPVGKKMALLVIRENGFTVQCWVQAQPDLVSPQMVKFASGSIVVNTSLFHFAKGEAKGMVTKARTAACKICWKLGCFDYEILAAMDEAVSDGVHVISLSISSNGYASHYYRDSIAIGVFSAIQYSVVVSCSAGNSGPGPYTSVNIAPGILTVWALTIDRGWNAIVEKEETLTTILILKRSIEVPNKYAVNRLGLLLMKVEGIPLLLVLDVVWKNSEPLIEKIQFLISDFKIWVTSRVAFLKFSTTCVLKLLEKLCVNMPLLSNDERYAFSDPLAKQHI